jgi:hypothetical protein
MAYMQWSKQWREHAHKHKGVAFKSFEDFRNVGIGKAVVCVANGYSFEENLETLKANQHNVDIFACDKTLGHLLDNGIKPTYCIVCDANVNYEKYLKPWEDQLQDTILFQNVCGNPKWTFNGNWKDRYFYVNKDVMNYEREFAALSGCNNLVTAGTNVSNMMIVLLTQCDNDKRQNLFGYDKILMVGFDYSWKFGGKYYAFDEKGGGKYHYMRHIYGVSQSGKLIFTSNNLSSSGSWLELYVKAYKVPVVQCSQDALYMFGKPGKLDEQIKYRHKPDDAPTVIGMVNERRGLEKRLAELDNGLRDIAREHWYSSQMV